MCLRVHDFADVDAAVGVEARSQAHAAVVREHNLFRVLHRDKVVRGDLLLEAAVCHEAVFDHAELVA